MIRFAASFAFLIGSFAFVAGQTSSHLDPGKVNPDCPNCQQIEQAQPDQQITPAVLPAKKLNNKYAAFVPILYLTNTNSQKVKQVTWQCTYIHANSGEIISTYTFVDKKKIAPGQSLLLQRTVFIPMAQLLSHPRVINANANTDENLEHPKVRQLIAIKEIKYADGTAKTPITSDKLR